MTRAHPHPTAAPDDAQNTYRWSNLAAAAAYLAKNPNDPMMNLRAAEIAAFLFDDAENLMDWARGELGIDGEGYPLIDAGDRDYTADRAYVPFDVEDARFAFEPLAGRTPKTEGEG